MLPEWFKYEIKKNLDAFTLVELLVVISIISLLMSIMMPALNKARQQANGVDCMSNMRQLTFAWMMYAHDNDGKLCSPWAGFIDDNYAFPDYSYGLPHWVLGGPWFNEAIYARNHIGGSEMAITEGVLWPYTNNIELYRCKSDPSDRLRSYAMSNVMGGRPIAAESYRDWQYRDIAQIPRSSEKLVFIDGQSDFRWLTGSFFPIDTRGGKLVWWKCGDGAFITARHRSGTNLSFADGHCSWWRYENPLTVEMANNYSICNPNFNEKVNINKVDLEYLFALLKGRN